MIKIYYLLDPRDNEIRYVGKTKYTLEARLKGHIYDAKNSSGGARRFIWIRSLLRSQVEPVIGLIQEIAEDHWENCERYWITYYRELGCDLVNTCDGGRGALNAVRKPWSEEAKVRQSERIKRAYVEDPTLRKKISESTQKAMDIYMEEHGDEHGAKVSAGLKNRYKDDVELRLKIGQNSTKVWSDPENRARHSETMKKAIAAELRVVCPTCGLSSRKSNITRHRKVQNH